MNSFANQIYKTAFLRWWDQCYRCQETDRRVEAFLSSDIQPFRLGESWLQRAREASLMSASQAADKMGISRAGFHAMETREKEGGISLDILARAAQALDCELVYAIRPKKKERFSVRIWKKLVAEAEKHAWVRSRPEKFQAQAMAKVARDLFQDPKFRQKQGWIDRRDPVSD
jgi:transcriptional regulator with XRE-family HTH domain